VPRRFQLGYWSFFPAEAPWGRLSVMGFGDVVRSNHSEVAEGERVFGFFPMSTHLVIDVDQVRATQFLDAAPRRRDTALAYRQYTRVTGDPLYEAQHEHEHMLLRGLFMTSLKIGAQLLTQAGAVAIAVPDGVRHDPGHHGNHDRDQTKAAARTHLNGVGHTSLKVAAQRERRIHPGEEVAGAAQALAARGRGPVLTRVVDDDDGVGRGTP